MPKMPFSVQCQALLDHSSHRVAVSRKSRNPEGVKPAKPILPAKPAANRMQIPYHE
jgi:hypothetical protein